MAKKYSVEDALKMILDGNSRDVEQLGEDDDFRPLLARPSQVQERLNSVWQTAAIFRGNANPSTEEENH